MNYYLEIMGRNNILFNTDPSKLRLPWKKTVFSERHKM